MNLYRALAKVTFRVLNAVLPSYQTCRWGNAWKNMAAKRAFAHVGDHVNWGKRLIYIYAPHLRSYLISACSVALGLSWKSGIAAEVIGVADGTIGEMLYEAKIYMATDEVMAWTVLFLVVSIALEKLLMALLRRGFDRLEAL